MEIRKYFELNKLKTLYIKARETYLQLERGARGLVCVCSRWRPKKG